MIRSLTACLAIFAAYVAGSTLLGQQPPAGKELFAKRCGGCHALDRDMEGPRLGGVYGRTAASLHSFSYSDALKQSKLKWDQQTLDAWLADPDKLAPGNDMPFRLENEAERSAIISYLKEQSPKR